MKKVILVTIPRYTPTLHYGLQLLAEHITNAEVEFYDANLDLYQRFANTDLWHKLEEFGIQQHQPNTHREIRNLVRNICIEWAEKISKLQPDYVGISVFTNESRNWAQLLCYGLRLANPDIKIVLGGRGLNDPGKPNAYYAEELIRWQLADYYINGEAEQEFNRLINDQTAQVNTKDLANINQNFSNIAPVKQDWSPYTFGSSWYDIADTMSNQQNITDASQVDTYKVTMSRGCVKTCTFCDVHLMRTQYSYRPALSVFAEIKNAIESGSTNIGFADDMLNGNNVEFMRLLELMANYLQQNNIENFAWSAHIGIKDQRSMPKEMFELLRITNSGLHIGIDHLSNNVLRHMRKHYTLDDINWFFEQTREHQVTHSVIMFVLSYPSETQQDFEIFKSELINLSEYKDYVKQWTFSNPCNIPHGSVLETLPGMLLREDQAGWYWDQNPGLTQVEKLNRRRQILDLATDLGLPTQKLRTQTLRIAAWK